MKEHPVESVMQPFPYAIQIDAPLLQARAMMREHQIRHLPVLERGELKGIVSDRDLKLLLGPELGSPEPLPLTVADACVDDCYQVDASASLADVLETMARRHIGAALVTEQSKLVGIFTTTDACRVFAGHLRSGMGGAPGAQPDA